jgi:hypothetical protein
VRRGSKVRLVAVLLAASACSAQRGPVPPELAAAGEKGDAIVVRAALEELIEEGRDTPSDRQYAYEAVQDAPNDTAATAFARAAVTGRYIQSKGLRAATLISEVEEDARKSRELDPDFEEGAATRMLGTLYVTAPATLLKHGNSEDGIELLETLTDERPDVLENHLRLAEGYITLGDPDPACPHLRLCVEKKEELIADDQRLLDQLLLAAGPLSCGVAADAGD